MSYTTLHLLLPLLLLPIDGTMASVISCTATSFCEQEIRAGSECVDGLCTNPFAQGCLRRHFGEEAFPKKRICNSEDPPGSPYCEEGPFDYPEIRVAPSEWESSIFYGWVIQILLGELMDVPVTLENEKEGSLSFYDPANSFEWPLRPYNFESLSVGHAVGDCRKTTENCAHVVPEVWSGNKQMLEHLLDLGHIEPQSGNGMVGKLFWGIPSFVAQKHPELMSHFGLANQRQKLAEMFKRPISFGRYCKEVSTNGCETPDSVATRPPNSESEANRYFVEGEVGKVVYTGHFVATDKNNCTLNPDTCTGHIIDGSCNWELSTEGQLFWNNISLDSDGPLEPNHGYGYFEMMDIYLAADATETPVVIWWFKPTMLVQRFLGEKSEMQIIKLPEPTDECVNARVGNVDRCSSNITVRRGPEIAACDDEYHALFKWIAASLFENTNAVPETLRSPGYEALKMIRISDLSLDNAIRRWMNMGSWDNYYNAREAVCDWVVENIDDLTRFRPRGYPRTILEGNAYDTPFLNAAMACAIFVALSILLSTALVHHWRHRKVMVYAQVNFLFMVLAGMLLVTLGAIANTIVPSLPVCVLRQWFINLGYSLEFIPLIVKVAAINKLMQGAKKMRRVKIEAHFLYSMVGGIFVAIVLFLVVWTAVDPPTKQTEWVFVDGATNDVGGRVVEVDYFCASSNRAWFYVAYAWQTLLLLCATVLAFQTRHIREEFNESQFLGFMIYSNFVFVFLRFLVFLLGGLMTGELQSAIVSTLLTVDSFFNLGIYFLPKFIKAANPQRDYVSQRWSSGSRESGDLKGDISKPGSSVSLGGGDRKRNITKREGASSQGHSSRPNSSAFFEEESEIREHKATKRKSWVTFAEPNEESLVETGESTEHATTMRQEMATVAEKGRSGEFLEEKSDIFADEQEANKKAINPLHRLAKVVSRLEEECETLGCQSSSVGTPSNGVPLAPGEWTKDKGSTHSSSSSLYDEVNTLTNSLDVDERIKHRSQQDLSNHSKDPTNEG